MNNEPSTSFTREELDKCNSFSEEMSYIKNNIEKMEKKTFKSFFSEYLCAHQNITIPMIIEKSNLPRSTANDIIAGRKEHPSRDRVIALCYAADMTIDEMNHGLIFSHNNPLYEKNSRDSIIRTCVKYKKRDSRSFSGVTNLNLKLAEYNQEPLDI